MKWILLIIVILAGIAFIIFSLQQNTESDSNSNVNEATIKDADIIVNSDLDIEEEPLPQNQLDRPSERASKKTFGQYITSQNSPVQPERFSGHHTGVDFEVFEDELDSEIMVTAFCDGPLVQKSTISGYGGVAVQQCTLDDQAVTVLYGHLSLTSITAAIEKNLSIGDPIGLLGADKSIETDGERKHLHFGIHKGDSVNVKGYVQSESELINWLDPLEYI